MSTPTPDYGEPWQHDTENNLVSDRYGMIFNPLDELPRIIACVNACAGIPDPAAEIARLREELKQARKHLAAAGKGAERNAWISDQLSGKNLELHKENDKLREALNSFDAIDKERNDALKTCMTLLENMHANRNQHNVAAYTNEIEAAMAQIKTCYDPHM